MVKVNYTKKFMKQLNRAPRAIQQTFHKRVKIFIADPLHPLLRNHQLLGILKGYRSINITGDWRALFRMSEDDEGITVWFVAIGTHSQLYS